MAHFPKLVDIRLAKVAKGTVHPEFISVFMQQFIYETHVKALSDVALSVLAEEEINKPVSERPENCFGSTILTNPGHTSRNNATENRTAQICSRGRSEREEQC